ncbi:hypothetical protein [Mesorhizobium sp.]|uniref:hypothetical protein n=1 Tax=Mesorhizobium sp. TaxID=1871066 RepID=UPI000FE7DC59|nr:hypothetical protein [Mesorhizobium sp.]RWP35347.1 MAG: hypothetical protein EOR03_13300 [Mesorhizobium sp.]
MFDTAAAVAMLEILVVRGVCRAINTVAFAPPRLRREICWSDCGSEAKEPPISSPAGRSARLRDATRAKQRNFTSKSLTGYHPGQTVLAHHKPCLAHIKKAASMAAFHQ